MIPNVAFIGKMGSGKSTAADVLVVNHGFTKIHFADALKKIAVELWGMEAHHNREYLQQLGVAVRRIKSSTWVDLALKRMDELRSGPFVVDDCRFPNEYEALAVRGFRFVEVMTEETRRVDRLMRIDKLSDIEQLAHESEIAIDDREAYPVQATVFNDGDPSDLEQQVESIMRRETSRV